MALARVDHKSKEGVYQAFVISAFAVQLILLSSLGGELLLLGQKDRVFYEDWPFDQYRSEFFWLGLLLN